MNARQYDAVTQPVVSPLRTDTMVSIVDMATLSESGFYDATLGIVEI